MMLSNIAIASLAFGSAGLVASIVQSQFVQTVAFCGSVVPQNGHCIVSQLTICGCGGASLYSITNLRNFKVSSACDFVKRGSIRSRNCLPRRSPAIAERKAGTSQEPPDSSSIPCHFPCSLGMCDLSVQTLSEIVEYTTDYLPAPE